MKQSNQSIEKMLDHRAGLQLPREDDGTSGEIDYDFLMICEIPAFQIFTVLRCLKILGDLHC